MSLKSIFSLILIILVIYFFFLISRKSENFYDQSDNSNQQPCYSTCKDRQFSAISDVCPDKPECVGICVNQHTYTPDNILDEPLRSSEEIGILKNGQRSADVISTNCGLCIANFYPGLKKMHDLGTECSQK